MAAPVEAEGLLGGDDVFHARASANILSRIAAASAVIVLSATAGFAVVGSSSRHAAVGSSSADPSALASAASPSSSSLAEAATSDHKAAQPHIILFTVDDMGWNDVGWRSSDLPNATTFMNELAAKSVLMTQYYSQPSCTPSRATIMTGKWAHKNGFQNYELHVADPVGVPLSNKLMPEYMADLGYKSHMVGKWNIGHCNSK